MEVDTILVTSSQLLVDQSTPQVTLESPASIRPLDILAFAQVTTSPDVFISAFTLHREFVPCTLGFLLPHLNEVLSVKTTF